MKYFLHIIWICGVLFLAACDLTGTDDGDDSGDGGGPGDPPALVEQQA